MPSESSVPPAPAIIAVNTSGAPLPRASSVTPARFYDSLKKSDNFARQGDK